MIEKLRATRDSDKLERRGEILDAAERLFIERPSGLASMDELAQASGVANTDGAADADGKYRVGTLVYTKAGLFVLFSWLLWGDFCFSLFESVGGPGIIPLYLQTNYHISNLQVNIMFNAIQNRFTAARFNPEKLIKLMHLFADFFTRIKMHNNKLAETRSI